MINWRPIETSPKDGTLVRVRFADGEECDARNYGDANDAHNGWWSWDGLDFDYGAESPTHWVPL